MTMRDRKGTDDCDRRKPVKLEHHKPDRFSLVLIHYSFCFCFRLFMLVFTEVFIYLTILGLISFLMLNS